jgi:hypothetical protein
MLFRTMRNADQCFVRADGRRFASLGLGSVMPICQYYAQFDTTLVQYSLIWRKSQDIVRNREISSEIVMKYANFSEVRRPLTACIKGSKIATCVQCSTSLHLKQQPARSCRLHPVVTGRRATW